ncbi:thioredoxin [Flexithrix dorotheae]|uniref:thioredoxin n=1 Tax=Flexithrix dorotheae TaxID=70993 RepID=UPI00037B34CD|nr:thioredoxin [Flexithrix dorotheae]
MSKFNDLLNNSDVPVLVDFYADWCGPCKMMAPVLQEVAGKMDDKLKIIKVDVDKNPAVSQQYQIKGIPTMILFHKGKILWRESGAMPAGVLTDKLKTFVS